MRWVSLVPIGLLVAGAAAIADAVVRGGASLLVVVVLPVVTGSSAEFFLGVVFLFGGFLSLPWLFAEAALPPAEPESGVAAPSAPLAGGGGLVLIGPVPIFFGGWRTVSRRTRWWVALAGAVILGTLLAVAILAR